MISRHPLYCVWNMMRTRCANPRNKYYHNYGGRGIAVCERWRASFQSFLADMGDRPVGTTLERIDNNKGYSPENCRWATRTEQGRNKRNNVLLTIDGEKLPVTVWAERFGIQSKTVYFRLKLGWSAEDAVKAPMTSRRLGIPRGQSIHSFSSEQADAIARSGLNPTLIGTRLKRGWSFEKAVSTPARPYRSEGARRNVVWSDPTQEQAA